jgi:GNAT superfamily N-acetyltransferase
MSDSSPAPLQWRSMMATDLSGVDDLAARVHPDFPERPEILAEKLRLFPRGCFVLAAPGQQLVGYCFSHPWTVGFPPALDTMLQTLPATANVYFIHDLTLDASLRRQNLASAVLPQLVDIARELPVGRMMLVAVSGSAPFWLRMGFQRTPDDALQAATRAKYGAAAMHMERKLG